MIENRDILFLSGIRWEFSWQRQQQFTSLLALRNRVLFVEMSLSPANLIKEWKTTLRHWGNWKEGVREIRNNLLVVSGPPILPLGRSFIALNRFNQGLIFAAVRRIMRKLHFDKPLVWISDPYLSGFSRDFGQELTIFDWIHDDPGKPESRIGRIYQRLLEKTLGGSDLIFTPSRTIFERRGKNDRRYHYLPHGADWKKFSHLPEGIPEELKDIPGPLIGFSGTVGPALDFDLIGEMARVRRDWSFVFLGTIRRDPGEIRKCSNIFFLGPRDPLNLPRYLAAFRAGIIPYRTGLEHCTVHPVKTYEYLAAGIPVVSTSLPELAHLEGMIEMANGKEEFIAALERVLREDDPRKRGERRKFARDNSWEARFSQMERIIEDLR